MLINGWIALPDRPDASRLVAKWPSPSRWMLAHASGNLWLAGSLDHKVTLASVGPLRVAVIGPCPVTASRLTDLITGSRIGSNLDTRSKSSPGSKSDPRSKSSPGPKSDPGSKSDTAAELDAVARMLPGCFHLVASVDGVVRAQGSVTGMRRVFHTRIQGVPVVGDRASVLARMAGAAAGGPNVPLDERRQWWGVRPLPLDRYLRMDSGGTVDELRWQQRPRPEMALTQRISITAPNAINNTVMSERGFRLPGEESSVSRSRHVSARLGIHQKP